MTRDKIRPRSKGCDALSENLLEKMTSKEAVPSALDVIAAPWMPRQLCSKLCSQLYKLDA